MVMERLDAAGKHPDNQEPLQQFAIKEAKRLLRAAGVVDPGPKEQKPTAGSVPSGADSFIPPHSEVLSPEFAETMRNVVLQLPRDLPIGVLRYWDKDKRKELIRHERGFPSRTMWVNSLRQLPEAPAEWVTFMESLTPTQKSKVAIAFSQVMGYEYYDVGDRKEHVQLNTPLSDVAVKLGKVNSGWGKSRFFVAAAFRNLASS